MRRWEWRYCRQKNFIVQAGRVKHNCSQAVSLLHLLFIYLLVSCVAFYLFLCSLLFWFLDMFCDCGLVSTKTYEDFREIRQARCVAFPRQQKNKGSCRKTMTKLTVLIKLLKQRRATINDRLGTISRRPTVAI